MDIRFEWDENKNKINISKHGVDFNEASSVFDDIDALVIPDKEHSVVEDRFLILGLSSLAKLLVVCHCYRVSESVIRIISARKATRNETAQYEGRK
ncbi:MAG: BrnT family toxin [Acidaminococcaceae bacterium]|nr:BrnT family toxin [Acidaminococcaceae bacterium]